MYTDAEWEWNLIVQGWDQDLIWERFHRVLSGAGLENVEVIDSGAKWRVEATDSAGKPVTKEVLCYIRGILAGLLATYSAIPWSWSRESEKRR